MFGSLRKKLKEVVGRISGRIGKEIIPEEDPKAEEPEPLISEEEPEPIKKPELIEEPELKEEPEPLISEEEPEEPEEPIPEEKTEVAEPEPIDEPELIKTPEHIEKPIPEEEPKTKGLIPEEEPKTDEKVKPKLGFFTRIVKKEMTAEDVDKFLPELTKALLANDVALDVAEKISSNLRSELTGMVVNRRNVESVVNEALKKAVLGAMQQEPIDLLERVKLSAEPFIVLFVGFNGVGKTTTLAKVAHYFNKNSVPCVLVAADTFRAASIEQLEEHSVKLGLKMIKHQYGADPAAVVYDGRKYAAAHHLKAVLCDTAGRSHSNVNLMDELKKIARVNKPDMKILVLDSLTGNDIYDQAQLFDQAVNVDAIILTKADVYDKGGAALSAAYTLKKPIIFLGTGQGYDDLQPFDAEKIASSLFGE